MERVLCIGDMTGADVIFAGLERIPEIGTEELCREFCIKAGGCANTPMGLAYLGRNPAFLTELGRDYFGNVLMEQMREAGVDCGAVLRPDGYRTCVSAVLSCGDDRGFATFWDVSGGTLEPETARRRVMDADYIYTDMRTCKKLKIHEAVREFRKKLFVDACYCPSMKLDEIADMLRACEIFTANEVESRLITGEETIEAALQRLSGYARLTVCKNGANGCLAAVDGKILRAPACGRTENRDTTGAGDLFNAGLLHAYMNGWTAERCLRFANAAGGLAVSFYGGNDPVFREETIMKLYEKTGPAEAAGPLAAAGGGEESK